MENNILKAFKSNEVIAKAIVGVNTIMDSTRDAECLKVCSVAAVEEISEMLDYVLDYNSCFFIWSGILEECSNCSLETSFAYGIQSLTFSDCEDDDVKGTITSMEEFLILHSGFDSLLEDLEIEE